MKKISGDLSDKSSLELSYREHLRELSVSELIFWGAVLIVLLTALAVRLSIPSTPFIDGDIAGYLNPALKLFDGNGLTPENARGIYYPLFAWCGIFASGSINGIVLIQHLLAIFGLLLIIPTLKNMWGNEYPALKKFLVILTAISLGFNGSLIRMEHTIRPEGLVLFMAGMIFFLLFRFYTRTRPVWFFLLMTALILASFIMPKLILACAILGFFSVYQYIKYGASDQSKKISIIVAIIFLFIGLSITQNHFNGFDAQEGSLVPKNFFYVNSKIIRNSSAFEKHFTDNERKAILMAIANSPSRVNFILLGFNPDDAQYGPAAEFIEKQFSKDIYHSVMIKSLFYCTGALIEKALKQSFAYYFYYSHNYPERIPLNNKLDFEHNIEYSASLTSGLGNGQSKYIRQYDKELRQNIGYKPMDESEYELYCSFICHPLKAISPFVFLFFPFYALYTFLFLKKPFLLLVFLLHFCTLFTLTFIHTLDFPRYNDLLFPFLMLLLIPGIYYATAIATTSLKTKFNYTLKWPLSATCLVLLFIVINYDMNRFYSFDPYYQVSAPKVQIPLTKDSNEVRIFVIGGSTTTNLNTAENILYPYLLERKLKEFYPDKKITVVNAGMEWYTAKHSASLYITEYKQYKPDIIIILQGIDDLYRSFSPDRFAIGEFQSDYSHFYGPSIKGANPPSYVKLIYNELFAGYVKKHFWHYEKKKFPIDRFHAIPSFDNYMSALASSIRHDRVSCVIISQPSIYKMDMPGPEENKCWINSYFCLTKLRSFHYEYPDIPSMKNALDSMNNLQKQIAKTTGSSFVNADSLIPKNLEYYTDDIHLTTKGNQLMADILFKTLIADSVIVQKTRQY